MRKFLLRYMQEHGLSQADMAKILAITEGYMSMLVNGNSFPRVPRAMKFARTLGVSLDDLFSFNSRIKDHENNRGNEKNQRPQPEG